jgi:transposase
MSDPVSQLPRVFTPAFKEQAMARLDAGEALSAVARALELRRKVLYDWRKAWRAEGLAGLSRRRGRKPGWRAKPAQAWPDDGPPADGPPAVAAPAASELARANQRIAELERLAGRQQMGLDFFQKALQALNAAPDASPSATASSRRSKP